jgi:hypothetical protein
MIICTWTIWGFTSNRNPWGLLTHNNKIKDRTHCCKYLDWNQIFVQWSTILKDITITRWWLCLWRGLERRWMNYGGGSPSISFRCIWWMVALFSDEWISLWHTSLHESYRVWPQRPAAHRMGGWDFLVPMPAIPPRTDFSTLVDFAITMDSLP